jgi:hypothetical protein
LNDRAPLLAGYRRRNQHTDDVALAVEKDVSFSMRWVSKVTRKDTLRSLVVPIGVLHMFLQKFRIVRVGKERVLQGLG